VVEIMESDHHSFMLKNMGLLTGIAIFIHNFPESEACPLPVLSLPAWPGLGSAPCCWPGCTPSAAHRCTPSSVQGSPPLWGR
jgi:hypothetical protein